VNTSPDLPALGAARERANLGLPLSETTRFRFLKRVLYKISWTFLRHQVAFNLNVLDALSEVVEDIRNRQEILAKQLGTQMELGLRQAQSEIGDHIAQTQSEMTHLQLQMAQMMKNIAQVSSAGADETSPLGGGPGTSPRRR
jgi:uncharacterized coiled-coil protein SlyX